MTQDDRGSLDEQTLPKLRKVNSYLEQLLRHRDALPFELCAQLNLYHADLSAVIKEKAASEPEPKPLTDEEIETWAADVSSVYRIAAWLAIESRKHGPYTLLPSNPHIAAQFGCNASTVSRAKKLLIDRKMIVQDGKSHFVARPRVRDVSRTS